MGALFHSPKPTRGHYNTIVEKINEQPSSYLFLLGLHGDYKFVREQPRIQCLKPIRVICPKLIGEKCKILSRETQTYLETT